MKLTNRYGPTPRSISYLGIIIFLFSLSSKSAFSQETDQDVIKSSGKFYSEGLFVKSDRDLYISGEKVWLKIYKFNGLVQTPGNVSKIIYIELLDSENNPVSQLKTVIDGYSGSAAFRLPDTLRTGNYYIRSYTNWMKNFSEDLFSYRKISVINPFKINEIKIPRVQNGADTIIFFIEGGNLVAGIEGRIGFKSMDKDGEAVGIDGAVINSEDDTLRMVLSGADGYGCTMINPTGPGNLYLITADDKGLIRRFQLPPVKKEGITISVPQKSENSSILVRIKRSHNFIPAGNNLYLVIQPAGVSGQRKKINLDNDKEITISGKDMPTGLSHITILDGRETLLAERWAYNETGQFVSFKINIPKNSYSSREKIEMSVTASDSRGNPVESDFSVSVAKAVTVGSSCFEKSRFLQIPGLPTCNNDNLLSDINDLLIFYNSQDLKEMNGNVQGSNPINIPELEGHLISGNIKYRKTREPVKNENISLSFVGKTALCQFAKTGAKGEFHFKTSEHGMKEIVIQPLSETIKDYYVELNNPFSPATKIQNWVPFIPDTSKLAEINNVIISMQVKNIYEPYMPAETKNSVLGARPNFYGKPDNTILMSKYIELTSLKEVVKEIIPGVSTVKKNDKINFKLFYQYQSQPYENNPLVLVDGVPVYDLEKVITINSRDLEKIDVFTTRYYISDIVMDGILHFITKKGNLDVIDLDRSAYRVEYDLPELKPEFLSPDYSSVERLHDHLPDFRNTLYWNPDMHTDKTGKAPVEFYSSDESAEYIIVVEGITREGKTGSTSIPLTIKTK